MTPDIIGDALVQAFAERGYEARLAAPEALVVTLPSGPTDALDIGEWRAFAGRNSRAELPEHAAAFVRGFLRKVEPFQRIEEHSEIGRLISEERLRIRLYTEEELDSVPGMREALLNRPLAPGLLQSVVVDYPDSIMPLNRSSIGDAPENEIFAAALRASIEKEPHYTKTDTVWDVPILHVGETHRYVGSHAHVLKRYVGAVPYGALVSFPIPEYVIVHEIGDTHLFAAMETMQALARTHVEQGEKPLTSKVYWWRPGAYENLPEQEALGSGLVPDLRPVGIEVDHEEKSVAALTAESDELINLWMRDHS
ncbi:hypothetical protein GCM10010191_75650 [Actinomadura vinacea]|uniref:Uncharacterized protein n=1 Tax=Actinomadura vinacea TaxID=115336 RepID=A0ABN3K5B9_9ACTN